MKSFTQHLPPSIQLVLFHGVLIALEGALVIISLLMEPSQSGGLLGFSVARWAMLLLNILLLAGVCFASYKVWKNQAKKLEAWLSSNKNLFGLFFLSLILFGISLPAALGKIPAVRYFIYFGRIRPSLIWLALASGQVWLTLLYLLRKPILDWFRQFFPLGRKEQFASPLTKNQRLFILGIGLVYLAIQWASHIQVGESLWLPDSIDYIFPAETYAWNESGLWTHTKPWGAAVLYKAVGSSPVTIDAVQTILSALAWLALAWVFSKFIHRHWLRVIAFALILGFSLAPSVQMWNHIIQSESLSITLMVFIIAVWSSLLQRWRWEKLFALVFLFGWWIGTRETNVYLSLMAAGILVLVGLFFKRQRFYWALSVLLIFFGYINMQISEVPTIPRWLYPLTNTVLHRILPDEEYLSFFEVKGMPVSPELMALSGGLANSENFAVFNNAALDNVERWLYKRGKEVYIRFLIRHPVYTLTDPWIHVDEMLEPKGLSSYAPAKYQPVLGWLFGALLYPNSIWLVLLLALATVATTLAAKPWQDSHAIWLMLGTLVLFFPHFYLVWHGDSAEVGRHAIQASVQLRLSLWLLLLLALDTAKIRNGLFSDEESYLTSIVKKKMNIHLRKSQHTDILFLREMLYEAVFWRTSVNKPSLEEGLAYPDVSKTLADWGKKDGDTAVVALVNSIPVGAAWYRFWNDSNFDRGYIDENTPVLVIGVHRDYRHQGIGKEMIEWLIDYASKHAIQKISLMVSKDNYAINLYRQQGFLEYADIGDTFILVRKI